jgi:hypothetical protein
LLLVHAAVGIFPILRKKPGKKDTWGYGREIMEEILTTIVDSALIANPNTRIYVTLLGNSTNIQSAINTLHIFNTTHQNIHLMLTGQNLYVAELPTIQALYLHAINSHPRYVTLLICNLQSIESIDLSNTFCSNLYTCILSFPGFVIVQTFYIFIRKVCATMGNIVPIGEGTWYIS